jgi:hypothetical protein
LQAEAFGQVLEGTEDLILHGMVRVLHVKNHLKVNLFEISPPKGTRLGDRPGGIAWQHQIAWHHQGFPALGVQADLAVLLGLPQSKRNRFFAFFGFNLSERFVPFLNETTLRLISTVHPNETERNTNLRHYNAIQEKFIDWKKNYESLEGVPKSAPGGALEG